jgi:hypothetical protein
MFGNASFNPNGSGEDESTFVTVSVAIALVLALGFFILPHILRARARSSATTVIESLRIVDSEQWETETGPGTARVDDQLAAYLMRGSKLYTDLKLGSAFDAIGSSSALPPKDASSAFPGTKLTLDLAPSQVRGSCNPDL